jgi:hypothetical protein
VYGAKFIDTGTRTGVSILYVSVPRCSKRCRRIRHQVRSLLYGIGQKGGRDLELDGEHGWKPLD